MKNSYFTIFLFAIILLSCGHKKNPTGGKKDTTKPEIVAINPAEFSDISEKNIEVIFSKPIDRTSIYSGLYIYPTILKKKFKWDKNTLIIHIDEPLLENTNYYFSFGQQIECERGNSLDKNYLFVFKNGKLQQNRVAGKFIFEKQIDQNLPIQTKLMAADSTLIYQRKLSDSNFVFEDLNFIDHILEFYIDKNKNQKYDYGKEPFFKKYVSQNNAVTIDIEMSYADTIKPKIKSVKTKWQNQIEIICSEPIKVISQISIVSIDSLEITKNVEKYIIQAEKIKLICEDLDTLQYKIIFADFTDAKDNLSCDSILFDGKTLQDTIPPEIMEYFPRNNATVSELLPIFELEFNEIIFAKDIVAKFVEVETNRQIEAEISENMTGKFFVKPTKKLNNMTSYKLQIFAKDKKNNQQKNLLEINFIPIVRKNIVE
ncbi:MAG: hypothetical protein HN692_05285 [Candidatus Cloacimonetes bacterium]|jgi:PBP1b-binding outer membrane lipoprotein LpoB|nr:hypothetical protein [Candidatus Cloacimonadota bacterium]